MVRWHSWRWSLEGLVGSEGCLLGLVPEEQYIRLVKMEVSQKRGQGVCMVMPIIMYPHLDLARIKI